MSLVQPSNAVNAVKQPNLYTIRLAKVEDIPYIDKCNVENLPENYDYVFFKNHITKWPDLSLVAVDQNEDLVGYTLGKAELMQLRPSSFPGRNALFALENNAQEQQGQGSLNEEPAYQGHVTSIAVYMSHRKHGIAKKLMNTLHTNMANTYKIDTVNLHCRVGNAPAIKLYSELFKYRCASLIKNYYDDDEDAWCMQRIGLMNVYCKKAAMGFGSSGVQRVSRSSM